MSTSTAPYKGDGIGAIPSRFRERQEQELRSILRELVPGGSDEDSVSGDGAIPADAKWASASEQALDAVIAEAMWAASDLAWHRLAVTREEVRIELASVSLYLDRVTKLMDAHASGSPIRRDRLLGLLRKTSDRLRRLSLQTDGHLPSTADPWKCADGLERLAISVESHPSLRAAIIGASPVLSEALALRSDVAEALLELQDKPTSSERLQSQREREAWVAQELALRVTRVLIRHGIPLSSYSNSVTTAILKTAGEGIGLVMVDKSWQRHLLRAFRHEQNDIKPA